MGVWMGKEILKFLSEDAPIKVGPNGVDIGISEVWKIPFHGEVTIHGDVRTIEPGKERVMADDKGYYNLERGVYEVRTSNRITIPENAMGLLFPRSTFNRLGMTKSESAVWDSGYSGYGTQTVVVNVNKLKVHMDEKWFQLVFFDTREKSDALYSGHWQGEGKVEK